MDKNNSGLGCLIGLIALGFFLLFNNRIMIFNPVFLTLIAAVVILCIIVSVLGSKSSNKGNNQYRKEFPITNYHTTSRNPYVIKRVEESKPRMVEEKEMVKESLNVTRYCPFCGILREKDSIYCHNCGTRLDND